MTKNTWPSTLLAIFMVGCGLVTMAGTALSMLDYPPKLIHFEAILAPPRESPENLQPGPDEWPLAVAKHFYYSTQPPEDYEIQVRGTRGGGFIVLEVSASDREGTEALATWLGKTFAAGVDESYSSRDLKMERKTHVSPAEDVTLHSSPSNLFRVSVRFFLPTLVLIGGIALFLARRGAGSSLPD